MYKLYYSPGACSMAVHVILNELEQKTELVKVNIGGSEQDKALLEVNPRHQVPVLTKGKETLLEGGAIMTFLCDEHKSDLIPGEGWERAKALQWLMFGNSTLHAAYARAMFIKRGGGDQALVTKACEAIQKLWDHIETELGKSGGTYLCGDKITAGDILVTVIANWGFLQYPFKFGEKTKKLLKTVSSRPAYQQALAAENVEYKAAA